MVLALLKCYGSVESSSEEEFSGFSEKDFTMFATVPKFPIVLQPETDSSSECMQKNEDSQVYLKINKNTYGTDLLEVAV